MVQEYVLATANNDEKANSFQEHIGVIAAEMAINMEAIIATVSKTNQSFLDFINAYSGIGKVDWRTEFNPCEALELTSLRFFEVDEPNRCGGCKQ